MLDGSLPKDLRSRYFSEMAHWDLALAIRLTQEHTDQLRAEAARERFGRWLLVTAPHGMSVAQLGGRVGQEVAQELLQKFMTRYPTWAFRG